MSLLVVGLSHHGAPIEVLEAAALDRHACADLEAALLASEHVVEAVVVSTCNRTEIYAEGLSFHGALSSVTRAFADATETTLGELEPHLYVHYEDRGIAHAFSVAAGLDSMAVGEAQVLGQLRQALTAAQEHGHVGPGLNLLLQQALRVGKRVHTETAIDAVSRSLVDAGLAQATATLGPIEGLNVLVIGAGGMGALAAATAHSAGARTVTIVNRSEQRAIRLAERVSGTSRPWGELVEALAEADIVISSTGATGIVVTHDEVATALSAPAMAPDETPAQTPDPTPGQALERRPGRGRFFIDLALPHDIDHAVADLPGVTRLGLPELGDLLSSAGEVAQIAQARDIVTGEVAAYLTERSAEVVVPAVAALRSRAQGVVDDELARLDRRTPDLNSDERAEVERAVHRIVDKLLHTPTVRVKELARSGNGGSYAQALSELFGLDPHEVSVVSRPADVPELPSDDHGAGAEGARR